MFVLVGIRALDVGVRARGGDGLMYTGVIAPFVPPQFGIKLAAERWERAGSMRLREAVFCREQQLFATSDRDETDAVADTIVAVDYLIGMTHNVVGTVRIHAHTPEIWFGSRLAIDPVYRSVHGLGSRLVYRAVTTAHARGCNTFLAHVQQQNVPFFRRLAWEAIGEEVLFGRPHTLMSADLNAYPPTADDAAIKLLRGGRVS